MTESERTPTAGRAEAATRRDGTLYIVALCGGADRPMAAIRGRTAFEAASTPHLDRLASGGCNGLLRVIRQDIPPESDSGAMALLGYDPLVYYTGRGPLEGLGSGFWDDAGQSVAFRVNFASVDPRTGALDRRTSRDLSDKDLAQLVGEVREGVRVGDGITLSLTGFGRHRGILAFTSRRHALSGRVTNTDPGFRNDGPFGIPVLPHPARPLPCRPLDDSAGAATTARLVNEFVAASAELLAGSQVNRQRIAAGRRPANTLLVRDGGHTLPTMPSFRGSTGLRLSLYGQVPAERGLAELVGARFTTARPRDGEPPRDFYRRLVDQIGHDPAEVVFVHLKGPDEPGHDGRPEAKVQAINDIDEAFVGPLHERLAPGDTVVVTCDHATPCELGIHAPDPVPVAVFGPSVTPDGVVTFGERAAAHGGLPTRRACELLPWLLRTGRGRPCHSG